ncbi:MAG: ABC transporter permease subunit [Planctomycetaceae bacterium]|jgi:sodium transport system permease protein|nr:ABC transporter permease subunit [Planctomycetaceae bacterium]
MRLHHIFLLFQREVRDQLRDRRTLFMMFVLPLLLYPVMGIIFFQTGQFARQTSGRVLVILPQDALQEEMLNISQDNQSQEKTSRQNPFPPLFAATENTITTAENQPKFPEFFDEHLFDSQNSQRLLTLRFETAGDTPEYAEQIAVKQLEDKSCDAVMFIPPTLLSRLKDIYSQTEKAEELYSLRTNSGASQTIKTDENVPEFPPPQLFYTSSNQKSSLVLSRLRSAIQRWNEKVGHAILQSRRIDPKLASPIDTQEKDVAEKTEFQGASFWSKLLPMLLLLWALTGAFYPSIDLCAGEKERGTLETLLSSPAGRGEIVLSKLLTVMTFSTLTSLLNILCVGATAYLLVAQLAGVGLPPRLAVLWLTLALIPTAALFSALCIALASYARSSKEGQYYLTPLLLTVLPLVMIPMTPGQELNLGMAIIPVSGIVLTLSALLEGDYAVALVHLPIVLLVTLGCCVLAVRWAVEQFNSESVLFRESEKFQLQKWLARLLTVRVASPVPQAAIVCGIFILTAKYFSTLLLQSQFVEISLTLNVLLSQFGVVLLPVVFMTACSSSNVRETLRLHFPKWYAIPLALLLAIAWHPVLVTISRGIEYAYPLSDTLKEMISHLSGLMRNVPIGVLILLIAVLPGICEEIAFRGYILTGLDTPRHRFRAVLISAILFGATHSVLQQSLAACITGVILGWLAIRTRSIFPGVVFHITNNSIGVLLSSFSDPEFAEDFFANHKTFCLLIGTDTSPGLLYGIVGVTISAVIFAGLLGILSCRKLGKRR